LRDRRPAQFSAEFPALGSRQGGRDHDESPKPGFYGIVAELDSDGASRAAISGGTSVRRSAGIGPVSVDPECRTSAIGRQMMQHMLDRIAAHGAPGVRLVAETAYHNRSLSLYAKLGFEIREPLSVRSSVSRSKSQFQAMRCGQRDRKPIWKPATNFVSAPTDTIAASDLRDSIMDGMASVVEHRGGVIGLTPAESDTAATPSLNRTRRWKALICGSAGLFWAPASWFPRARRLAPLVFQQGDSA